MKTDLRQIRLSPLKEPHALGWVTSLPAGNNTAVIFSIGDQQRIDEWYRHVRKPFGKMEFTGAPVAVPPTLTIFVRHKAVKLDELKIPKGVSVSLGYVPTVFHRFNTKAEQQREEENAKKTALPPPAEKTDDETQAAADRILAYLKTRGDNTRGNEEK